jgi:hypothetical protein
MFLDARHLAGVGQARTRTRRSVERLVPFGLCCLSLAIVWYARHGQPAHDLAAHRARAPWYRHKHTVSVADMLAALRRALLAAQYPHGHPDQHILDLFPDALLTQLSPQPRRITPKHETQTSSSRGPVVELVRLDYTVASDPRCKRATAVGSLGCRQQPVGELTSRRGTGAFTDQYRETARSSSI